MIASTVLQTFVAVWLALVPLAPGLSSRPAASPAPHPLLVPLEAMVQRKEYRFAISRSRDVPLPPDVRVAWLRGYAEAGLPPFQSELAIHVIDADLDEGLKWYARGRLAAALDSAECGAAPGPIVPSKEEDRVNLLGVANPERLLKAVDEAHAWVTAGVGVQSAEWICGTKSYPDRVQRRAAEMRRMELAALRLRRYVEAMVAGRTYPMKVYEVPGVAVLSRGNAAWLDDDHLLYIAGAEETPAGYINPVYLWSLVDGSRRRLDGELTVREVCARDGRIWLRGQQGQDGEPGVWVGTPDRFERVSGVRDSLTAQREMEKCNPRWPRERGNHPLRQGEKLTLHDDGRPAEFVRADGGVVALPFSSREIEIIDYGEWDGTYLVTASHPKRSDAAEPPGSWRALFTLDRGGLGTPRTVPYGIWEGPYRYSRRGLIYGGGYPDDKDTPGWNGLFLFPPGGGAVQLVHGWYQVGGVSPNGCRVPISGGSVRRLNGNVTRVVDVCVR